MTLPAAPAATGDATPGTGPYAVKLPSFEGPLDLLLHLIRLNEVEIADIPIARIGQQYLEYLDLMRELDFDVAGEYLLMAATLAWIKSRMLLPPDGDAEGEEIDPRAELAARLLEYQRFKEAAGELGERRLLGRDVFEAQAPGAEPPAEGEREIEIGLFELLEAFRRALRRAGPSGAPHEVEVESITVRERMIAVMEALEPRGSLEFEHVLSGADGQPASRSLLVATFLALLELARIEALRLYQGVGPSGAPQGPIHLRLVTEGGPPGGWRERIADIM
jgi:segregation and condensation protein A